MNKKRSKLKILALFLVSVWIFTGCQEPIEEVIDPPADAVITANSNVATLLQRVSLNDGSDDNIVDSSSCISLVLPFTVNVNGLEIVVDSEDDLELIEDIFDEFENDDDLLEILFPITVILPDHSEFTIENEDALEDLAEQCDDDEDEDIECLDFEYPITVSTYDTINQTSSVIVLENDEDLYNLIEDLDEDELVGINFPITVILADSSTIEINNNHELEEIIEDVEDDCDEDDDDDYDNDHEVDTTLITPIVLEGQWIVASYDTAGNDITSDFEGFTLEFFEDGTMVATDGTDTFEGTWEEHVEDDLGIELVIEFDGSTLIKMLNDDWDVLEYSETRIELSDEDEVGNDTSVLILERL